MQLNATMRLNRNAQDPRTYLMFHGYGNDQT